VHNYVQSDRKHDTDYVNELSELILQKNGVYELADNAVDTKCIQNGYRTLPEVSIDKNSIDKNSVVEVSKEDEASPPPTRSKRFVPPTVEEVAQYCFERMSKVDPQRFVDYYTSNGWMVGKNKMKDWKAAVRTWDQKEKPTGRKGGNVFLEIAQEEGIV
jgi:hypothetical protein